MRVFEDLKYEQWKENVEASLPGLLKRNLLVKKTNQIGSASASQQIRSSLTAIGDANEERNSIGEIQGLFHFFVVV